LLKEWQPEATDLISLISTLCTNDTGETLLPLSHEENGDRRALVTRVTLPNGKNRWLEIRTQPTTILGEKGHFFWVNDITDTKQSEINARREAELADAAAQAKSNFLATMSHEIRTPLQTIFGMLELMTEENPTDKQLEMINAVKHSSNGLLGILDDILDLAKVEAGRMELDTFEMPLRTLVYGIIESLESKRRENNLYINAEIDETIPFVVMGDPKRLRQVLLNLLGNGLKFTETGGITVKVTQNVRHIKAPEGGLGLRFEITDTGIGMTPDVAAKLFQPFTQADNSTTRRFGGTGLGLSIAQRLIELMQGDIGVISEEGKGSTFWFEIPTKVATENKDLKLPDLTGLTVLSIEDHPKGAKEIHNSLQSMGAIVTTVGTAAEGLDLVHKRPFDVAVVDHGLPDGRGAELLKQINKVRPFMGLILYTVHDDYDVKQICKFLGAKYLSKPASRLGLGEAVKGAAKQTHRLAKDGPRKLLICEDNETVRDIFTRQLKIIGVEADFAMDGQEAWEILQENRHGIVITDLHMPRMDGYGLARAVRSREENGSAHMPVIAMTADVQLVHEQSYLKHGFDECLLKPVSLGQIRQLLIRWGLLEETSDDVTENDNQAPEPPLSATSAPAAVNGAVKLPNKPVIDPKMAEQQFGAFDDDAKMMIGMFIDMSGPQIAEMEAAFAAKDWQKLKGIAHSLKGAARSACCPQLGDVAEAIQTHSASGFVANDVMSGLVPAFDNVKTEFQKYQ
jgi:two-component system, sensor histidine kinase and response regulator